ncbi:MAG: bifunctional heptose 7-phosphate kinase/heptose 1-phosphate adenyltransferase, partial [Terriglobales bacterium]
MAASATPKTPRLTAARLRRDLAALQGRRVAVVGDAMLDEFLWGDATRISPEAPVPVVLLEQRTWSLGGAANVAANVAALGGRPLLFAVVGADAAGERLRQLAHNAGIELGALPALPSRPTTVKHRVFARNKHLLRFDLEETAPISAAATRELLARLEAAPGLEAVVVSDYAKGCVTAPLIRGIARLCRARSIPWCADPKLTTIRHRHAQVLKPNLLELEALSGMYVRNEDDLRRAAAKTLRRQGCAYVLVTRGQHGMALFGADRSERWLNSTGRQVADVTGAGD